MTSHRIAAMGAGVLISASLAASAGAETAMPAAQNVAGQALPSPASFGQMPPGQVPPGQMSFGQTLPGQTVASAPPQAVPAAAPTALTVLLDQARFWQQQSRLDLAIASLDRAFEADPRSADALALAVELHAQQGDRQAAEADLAKLRAMRPDDPRLGNLAQTVAVGPIDQAVLADARVLAQQGRYGEAIDRYRAVFHGNVPPDSMAVEYYQVLAGTDAGWDEARLGLAQLVRRTPQDTGAQLAYAEVLTYRPPTRADGLGRLAILANNPATASAARSAWRQALDWLPVDPSSIPLYQAYLTAHPDDAGLEQRMAEARNPHRTPTDEAGLDRKRGFDALEGGNLKEAEAAFQAALAINAQDSDALGGLGLVRQRQNKPAEARDLLARAVAAAPDKAAQWQSALTGATIASDIDSAKTLARSGQYAQATAQLRDAIAKMQASDAKAGDVMGLQLLLADTQARGGDLAGAEETYRAILAHQPNNAGAVYGLANMLTRRGRVGEAQALLVRAGLAGRGANHETARAQQLRNQAQRTSDPQTQIALLRGAAAAAPSDPWIRLDLARALAGQGQAAEAQATMAAVTDVPHPSADALHAAALFAMSNNQPAEAAALAERIPPGSRSADVKRLLSQGEFEDRLRRIIALGPLTGDTRQQLLVLAAGPDPDGARGAAVARAFVTLRDPSGARQAIAAAVAANPNPTPAARIAYAGALLSAGQSAEAMRLVASVDMQGGLTADQQASLQRLRDGVAVQSSDKLNQQGRTAEAYDHLAPALRQSPTDPNLNLALGRLYQTAREPKQTLAIAEGLLRRDPGNLDARRAAVDAAIQIGNMRDADRLTDEGKAMSPDDPRVWIMAADVARARGDNGQVLSALRTAQQLRRQQLGADAPALPTPSGAAAEGQQSITVQAPGGNPFRGEAPASFNIADTEDVPTDQSTSQPPGVPSGAPAGHSNNADPMSADIARAIAAAQAEASAPDADGQVPRDVPAAPMPGSAQTGADASSPEPSGTVTTNASAATAAVQGTEASGATPDSARQVAATPPPSAGPARASFNVADTPDAPPGLPTDSSFNPDPMSAEIARGIAAAQAQVAPSITTSPSYRYRTGSSGLDQLNEVSNPVAASFSPGGYGRMTITATPVYLWNGQLSGYGSLPPQFGTLPLAGTLPGPLPGNQTATGVALQAAYKYRWLAANVGSTPLGFRVQNVTGGLEVSPEIIDGVRLRGSFQREPVTDSLLSYAGTVDTGTGQTFGGVMRNRGHSQIEFTAGLANFYAGGGYSSLNGRNVESNNETEFGAGGSYPIWRDASDELRAGLDLVYFAYDKNLSHFTFGQGGYFSPQNYYAALIPLTFTHKQDNLTWSIGGSVGGQTYNESSSAVFPNNPSMQAQLNGLAASNSSIVTSYPSQSQTGVVGGVHASLEYQVTPSLKLGGLVSYNHAGNWSETQATVFARYIFNAVQ